MKVNQFFVSIYFIRHLIRLYFYFKIHVVHIQFVGVELYKRTFHNGMKQTLKMLISIIRLIKKTDCCQYCWPNWMNDNEYFCSVNQHNGKMLTKFFISIQTACRLYTNLTARWKYGTGIRVYDGALAEAGEFPWMV